MRKVAFGVALLKNPRRQGKTEHWTKMGIIFKCRRHVRETQMLLELTVAKPAVQLGWSYFANSVAWINTTVYRDCDNNSVEVKSPVENISFCFWIMFPVTSKLFTNSFQQTGLYPRGEPFEDEPFNGQELDNLKTTMGRIYTECSVAQYAGLV